MRYEETKERQKRNILRFKKAVAVLTAFFIVFGIAAVDRECARITGQEEKLIPQIRLMEKGRVEITVFSHSYTLNSVSEPSEEHIKKAQESQKMQK